MSYKMLVCDYDMTLGIRPNIISKENLEAVKDFQKNGGIFVLCTGRMYESIKNILDEYNLKCDIVSYQGALINDKDGNVIYDGGIDYQTAYDFVKLAEDNNENINIFVDDTHYTNVFDKKTMFYEYSSRTKAHLLDCKPSDYILENKCKLRKVIFMAEADVTEQKIEKYQKDFPTLEINSGGYYLTEIINKNENKGKAIEFLAKKYNLDLSEIIAIGDSTNDISMIKTAGLGIAVGDGSEQLKKVADEVTLNFEDNAVAHVINKYCKNTQNII